MSVFFDTNILLYAALIPPDDETCRKRDIARELLTRDDGAISLQVLVEFVNQALHPRRPDRLTHDQAAAYLARWREFDVQETTLAVFDHALAVLRRDKLSWWDCLIAAAASAQGCDILYSEDMQDGRIIDGMRIVDPFRD